MCRCFIVSETVFEVMQRILAGHPNLICLVSSCRDLPVPLLTKEYLPTFASIVEIDELKEQVRTLNLLILLLPSLHQRALKVAYTVLCVCVCVCIMCTCMCDVCVVLCGVFVCVYGECLHKLHLCACASLFN